MGRPATGHLSENRSAATGRLTSWGLQFSHAGRRRYVTLPATTRDQALSAMEVVMDEVPKPQSSHSDSLWVLGLTAGRVGCAVVELDEVVVSATGTTELDVVPKAQSSHSEGL